MFSSPEILSIHCEDGVFFRIFFTFNQNCIELLSHRVSANFSFLNTFFNAFYITVSGVDDVMGQSRKLI